MLSCLHLAISQTRSPNSYDSSVDPSVQWIMCLFSPVAFAAFIDQGIFLDIQRNGFHFNDSLTYGKFPLYAPLLMMFVDMILYGLLTWYLDKVIPSEYGVRYHPLFFLKPSYWCPGEETVERISLMRPPLSVDQAVDIEPVGLNMADKVAMSYIYFIKIICISKELCLDIYEGQITCLLGHNGAGKTTLMSMLTGVVSPTKGTATIMGSDITKLGEMEKIRKICGICPQHDIIHKELSCREHLEIFANIKGIPPKQIPSTVKTSINYATKSCTHAGSSTFMAKRKQRCPSLQLSLLHHFLLLIFLDEPTAGMDPFSRRRLWTLLKKRKEGRVILLTTHFMDEADILSDRKAFMSKGKLRCCGSSLFLKNKFGVGYHLTMVAAPSCNVQRVTSSLQGIIPSIKLERSHGKEISYTVPLSDVDKF
ncbi:hypothetical protein EGW08_021636, partial [Elysia chlorotica]